MNYFLRCKETSAEHLNSVTLTTAIYFDFCPRPSDRAREFWIHFADWSMFPSATRGGNKPLSGRQYQNWPISLADQRINRQISKWQSGVWSVSLKNAQISHQLSPCCVLRLVEFLESFSALFREDEMFSMSGAGSPWRIFTDLNVSRDNI